MPATLTKNNQDAPAVRDRVFRAQHTLVGPWRQNEVFLESQFKAMHPIPKNANGEKDDGYHDALIGRLLALKAITVVPDDLREGVVIPQSPKDQTLGSTVRQATAAVMEQRNASQQAIAAQPPAPTESNPAIAQPPRPVVQQGTVAAAQPVATQPAQSPTAPASPAEPKH